MSFYSSTPQTFSLLNADILKKAYYLLCLSMEMNQLYEKNPDKLASVLSTARGHEALQIATVMHLKPHDYLFPCYRDDAMFLAAGISPYELFLEALGNSDAPVSGGRRSYLKGFLYREDMPSIPLAGSAGGAHIITATAVAQGLMYLISQNLKANYDRPIVLCSLDDSSMTEGDITEAFHIAIAKKLPIVYLLQDNDWTTGIKSEEIRAIDGYELAGGFKGMKRMRINGADFVDAYDKFQVATDYARLERMPVVVHAKCPLLGHYSTQLLRQAYRTDDNIGLHLRDEPQERLRRYLLIEGESEDTIAQLAEDARILVKDDFESVLAIPLTTTQTIVPAPSTKPNQAEQGNRNENGTNPVSIREAAIHALAEMLLAHPEALYYGMDAASKPGGRYKETEGLAQTIGSERIINMPDTGAYLAGSVVGLALAGCKPMVGLSASEMMAGIHQLQHVAAHVALLAGEKPVSALIRLCTEQVSLENLLLQMPGLPIVYPSNAADMKGLLKAAWAETVPVLVVEHTSLYTCEQAHAPEPDADYVLPLGKARVALAADPERQQEGYSMLVITYGPGVHWAISAAETYPGSVEVLDLRTLHPLDWDSITAATRTHNKVLILTPALKNYSFAEALAAQITTRCFSFLDAPVQVCGSDSSGMYPSVETIAAQIEKILND